MRLGRTSLYGLCALIYLSDRSDTQPATVATISQATGIPVEYLRKLLGRMLRGRLIRSVRGRNGGFLLMRPRHAISLLDLVEAIEGPIDEATIFDDDLLAIHSPKVSATLRRWRKEAVAQTRKRLASTTIASLLSSTGR